MMITGITIEQASSLRPGDRVWNASYPNSEFVVTGYAHASSHSSSRDIWVPTAIVANRDRYAPDKLDMINHLMRIIRTVPECVLLPQGA